jgi:oxygen-dependent protoporphyrinogen oxidase
VTRPTAIVIGAGAAGVTAGFWLQRHGFDVQILEASDRVGGRCRTEVRGGYRFDVGAGALPSTYTNVRKLIDALGISGEVERRGAVIGTLADGRVHRMDRRRPQTFVGARQLSARSKAQLWRFGVDLGRMYRSINPYDLSTAARFDIETVRQWSDRHHLSTELRERFIAALCRALFLVEPEQTSVVDLFSAAKSLLVAGHLLTHPDGVGFFIERAAAGLDVHLSSRVSEVRRVGAGVHVRWSDAAGTHGSDADSCVVALSGRQTAEVLPDLDDSRRQYLLSLEYSQSIVVQLGVRQRPDETASMVLVPRDIEPCLPVVGLGHNLAANRAPAGGGVLTAFYMNDWSLDHWGDDDEKLVGTTSELIDRHFPGWADDVEATVVTRWAPALVASRPGNYRNLADFQGRCDPSDRIQLAGDYLAQTSVNASVASGERAAERLRVLAIGRR